MFKSKWVFYNLFEITHPRYFHFVLFILTLHFWHCAVCRIHERECLKVTNLIADNIWYQNINLLQNLYPLRHKFPLPMSLINLAPLVYVILIQPSYVQYPWNKRNPFYPTNSFVHFEIMEWHLWTKVSAIVGKPCVLMRFVRNSFFLDRPVSSEVHLCPLDLSHNRTITIMKNWQLLCGTLPVIIWLLSGLTLMLHSTCICISF